MLYRDGAVPGNGLETFSVVFDELPCDEREYIDAVVRRWDLNAHLVAHEQHPRWVGIDQMHLYPDVLYQTTLLMGAPALHDMRKKKMRVVLDGIGGDELLAPGFAHLTDLVSRGSVFRLVTQLRHDSRIYDVPLRSLVWAYCCRPFVPSVVKKSLRPFATWLRRNRTASPLRPEFVAATALQERARVTSRIRTFPTHAQQEISDGLASGWNAIGTDLNELFSARFSVESRRPFFDRRVVEFLLAIPGDQRWRDDEPKRILRRAMDGILPGAVQSRRSKTEFSPCIDRELRVRQADAVEETFRHSTLASLGLVDADRFLELFLTYRAEACYYPSWNMELLLALELWCRSIVRSPTN
jgi:asparagine synthase (glutamine-hydrolysing)